MVVNRFARFCSYFCGNRSPDTRQQKQREAVTPQVTKIRTTTTTTTQTTYLIFAKSGGMIAGGVNLSFEETI
uniref:Uncharacterized protein n=1 Tax=Bursaphelenchus xylophilus TaxID=6326 RepID=A0A1I7RN58_BURXY